MPEWLENLAGNIAGGVGDVASGLLGLFYNPDTGEINYQNLITALGAYGISRADDSSTLGDFFGTSTPQPTGYTGGIPQYEYKREVLPEAFAQTYTQPATEEGGLPTVMPRRPGSGGRYYFTQGAYQPKTTTEGAAPIVQNNDGPSGIASDLPLDNQARNQAYINRVFGTLGTGVGNSPEREDYTEGFPSFEVQSTEQGNEYARRIMQEPGEYSFSVTDDANYFRPEVTFGLFDQGLTPEQLMQEGGTFEYIYPGSAGESGLRQAYEYWQNNVASDVVELATGGMASLDGMGQGYYLGGPTDGMADLVPATIDGNQPAALSDGEFVIPADVVSHLGNGNSDAGAQQLYSMMDRVRRERTGTTRQGPEINPTRMMPA